MHGVVLKTHSTLTIVDSRARISFHNQENYMSSLNCGICHSAIMKDALIAYTDQCELVHKECLFI